MKRVYVVTVLLFAVFGYLVLTGGSQTPAVNAAKAYNATVYVAGHGGHFAKADITIDPNNNDNPIKINGLDKVDIGTTKSHKTHDARIDSGDSAVMFWSTYALDEQGKQHVGKSDLKTGEVVKDIAMDPDPRAPGKTGPLYCASGQSKHFYMPVFMGSEAYVDVIDKKTMDRKHRVFLSDLGYKAGSYQFLHGINNNKMDKFLLTVTMKGEDGKMNGKNDFVVVDMASLEKGSFKQLAKATLTGEPSKTISFRQYFSKDDKLIFQAGGDRAYVLDAATLKPVNEKMSSDGENHDLMPTPDGKYALLTLRTNATAIGPDGKAIEKDGKPVAIKDGALQLYDAGSNKLIGKPASVCIACHKGMGLADKTAILCGMDANYKK